MGTNSELPAHVAFTFFVCVRMEDGDKEGRSYGFTVTASGPSGQGITGPGAFRTRETAPQLINPQRFYQVIPVDVDVDEAGQWTVTLSDASGVRAVVPYYFSVVSPP
jgi:hypothetical protein